MNGEGCLCVHFLLLVVPDVRQGTFEEHRKLGKSQLRLSLETNVRTQAACWPCSTGERAPGGPTLRGAGYVYSSDSFRAVRLDETGNVIFN